MPIENQEESTPGSNKETDAAADKTRVMPPRGTQDSSDPHGEDATRVMLPPDDKTEVVPADEDATRVMPVSARLPADTEDKTRPMQSGSGAAPDPTAPHAYGAGGTVMQPHDEPLSASEDTTHLQASHESLDVEAIRNKGDRVIKDRFVLEKLMGAGGMGSVYKARDLRKVEARDRNPWVAIKLLNDDFRAHPEAFISLQREARKSQTLAHPNIIQVFDFDKEGDSVFMTMELLDGKELSDFIKENPEGIELDEALRMTQEMGAALGHAHDHMITHADFKPGNVFLTTEGKTKVLDFGIARAVSHVEDTDDDGDDKTVFDPGSLGALTPAYASLEMLMGLDPQPSDDIYALGCVTYQLLTGKHPYNKVPANEALTRGLIPTKPAKLSRAKWRALQRAIALEREERFESVDQFLSKFAPVAQPWGRGVAIIAAIAVIVGGIGAWQGINSRFDEEERSAEMRVQQELLSAKSATMDAAKTMQAQLNTDFQALQGRVEQMKNGLDQRLFQFEGSTDWQQQTDAGMAALSQVHAPEEWQALLQSEQVTDEAVLVKMRESEIARRDNDALNVQAWLENFRQKISDNYLELSRAQSGELRFVAAQSSIDTAREFHPDSSRLQEYSQGLEDAIATNRAESAALAREAAEADRLRRLAELEVAFQDSDAAVRANLATCTNTLDRTGRGGTFSYDISALASTMATQARQFKSLSSQLTANQQDYIVKLGACIQVYGYSDHVAASKLISSASEQFPTYAASLQGVQISPWDNCKSSFVGRGERYSCQDRLIGSNAKGPALVMVPAGAELDVFAIGKYEVTEAEFNSYCTASENCAPSSNNPELPVTGRSHTEVENYLSWLSEKTGFQYRLPALASWQYAANSVDSSIDSGRNCTLDSRGIVKGQLMLPADIGGSNRWGMVNHVGNARELVIGEQGIQTAGGSRMDPMDDCTLATTSRAKSEGDELTGFRVMRTIK